MKVCLISIGFMALSVSLSAVLVTVNPDEFAAGTDISAVSPYVTLSSGGGALGLDGKVYSASTLYSGTGGFVFANKKNGSLSKSWLNTDTNGYYFRADFFPLYYTNYVSIDVISTSSTSYPSLWYGTTAGDFQLAVNLSPTISGQIRTLVIDHRTTAADITYIQIGGYGASTNYSLYLDNLRFEVPEPASCLILLSGLLLLKNRNK